MKPTVTHLVEEGQSIQPGKRVKTWCGRYITSGGKEELQTGQRPTCPTCLTLQARSDALSVGVEG
jgi:hypothetical protein